MEPKKLEPVSNASPKPEKAPRKRTVASIAGAAAAAMAGALVGVAAATTEAVASIQKLSEELEKPRRTLTAEEQAAKRARDGGWRRTTGGGRGWYPVRQLAKDPVPMTRQVARRYALKSGWGASEFRRFMGA